MALTRISLSLLLFSVIPTAYSYWVFGGAVPLVTTRYVPPVPSLTVPRFDFALVADWILLLALARSLRTFTL